MWIALRHWDNVLDGTWVALKLMQRLTKDADLEKQKYYQIIYIKTK